MVELITRNKYTNKMYYPVLGEGMQWTTERKGSCGKLTFKCLAEGLDLRRGNPVRTKLNDIGFFYGYCFTSAPDTDGWITVTCYDQIRYLLNKGQLMYTNKTASEVIKIIGNTLAINIGDIADTSYIIDKRDEDNATYLDMILTALSFETQSTGKLYCLYDDWGKLVLRNINDMQINHLIDVSSTQDLTYKATIDSNVYDKIVLAYDNKETGKRELYVTEDSKNIWDWGVLQYYKKINSVVGAKNKADTLLKYYNREKRTLVVKNVAGNIYVRAGCKIPVSLDLGDIVLKNYMIVDKAVHTFNNNEHFMDLTLIGHDFTS
ncbi:hydrolase [Clostridium botulinum]|nr:hydrolase [Clostridium botulinum]NFR13694.1 hydrolase [Clostridium botulinum]NFR42239.1 hydrolase [Clostridium botulinum]NFS50679.1 hydrolase [Clostridium botulinum]